MGQLKTGGPEKQNCSKQEELEVSESPFQGQKHRKAK